ncbi:hypothetical protein [Maridesulfovibrio sp.]|uniref:hypothetical protein n=1 Tax=Maridesulfovibrio sp. TaxID=2795000 RepID=UPI0029F4F463|nr:hypothetical protein [Maridesulfovibrio sp.]
MLNFMEASTSAAKVFLNWQTYGAFAEFLAISLIPMLIFWAMYRTEGNFGEKQLAFSSMVMSLMKTLAIYVFMLTLSPVILGVSDSANWLAPWVLVNEIPIFAAQSFGILMLFSIFAFFIPMLAEMSTFRFLIMGTIALGASLALNDPANPQAAIFGQHLVPDVWFCVFIIALTFVLNLVGCMFSWKMTTMLKLDGSVGGLMLMYAIAAIVGFIPVLIYGAWIGAHM